jgi:hypothetical protein
MPTPQLPPWELTRYEYFRANTSKVYNPDADHPAAMYTWFIKFEDRRPFTWQQAWDQCAYSMKYGHFWRIARQVENARSIDVISLENWVEYMDSWNMFFHKFPELQDARVVATINGKRVLGASQLKDHAIRIIRPEDW